jgi:hypothetical protein
MTPETEKKAIIRCGEWCGYWNECKGRDLFRIFECIVTDLHEANIIHICNGSEGIMLTERLFNASREFSTSRLDSEGKDLDIPLPCEIMGKVLEEKLKRIKDG